MQERRWLYGYGQSLWNGKGEVVDLGCWFGSSTAPLAAGIAANRHFGLRKVHAHDLFQWDDWMGPYVEGTPFERRFRPGDSFLPAFEECTAPYRDHIQAHVADLAHTGWERGPIELLFVDAMKSWELANGILGGFFPAVMPGLGVVAHQDFAHWHTPWIHLLMHRLRQWYEPVYAVPQSSTFVWRCVARPPDEVLLQRYSFADFDESEIDAAFAGSASLVRPEMRPAIAAARAMVEVHRGDLDRASALLHAAEAEGLSEHPELGLVRDALARKLDAVA